MDASESTEQQPARYDLRLWWRYTAMWFLRRWAEKSIIWFVWRLPRGLVYWCTIRLLCNATQGEYSSQEVPSLLAVDALKRWER